MLSRPSLIDINQFNLFHNTIFFDSVFFLLLNYTNDIGTLYIQQSSINIHNPWYKKLHLPTKKRKIHFLFKNLRMKPDKLSY